MIRGDTWALQMIRVDSWALQGDMGGYMGLLLGASVMTVCKKNGVQTAGRRLGLLH